MIFPPGSHVRIQCFRQYGTTFVSGKVIQICPFDDSCRIVRIKGDSETTHRYIHQLESDRDKSDPHQLELDFEESSKK
jgi:hypothetical protein